MDNIAENFQTYDSGYNVEISNRTPMKWDELRFAVYYADGRG